MAQRQSMFGAYGCEPTEPSPKKPVMAVRLTVPEHSEPLLVGCGL
jgi:hypothetical protein